MNISKNTRATDFSKAMESGQIEASFLNMKAYLPFRTIPKSSHPIIFPKFENIPLPLDFNYAGRIFNTLEYLDYSYTQGLLVLQNDTIVYENYWRGQNEASQHIAWSVSKSYVSALFGIALEEGYIRSIEQTVDEYLPELIGTDCQGIKIKDVLQMSSGIKFDETYSNPESDVNKFWDNFLMGNPQINFIKGLRLFRQPGTYNDYISVNTDILGLIIARATNQNLSSYLREKLLDPLGTEFEANWITDNEGVEIAHAGFNASMRDFAKLGSLYLHKGCWKGKQLVPAAWVEASTHSTEAYLQAESLNSSKPGMGYGYQWWLCDGNEGEFMAIGVYNQYIYVNPTRHTVIVKNSANQNYNELVNPFKESMAHLELFRKIARR